MDQSTEGKMAGNMFLKLDGIKGESLDEAPGSPHTNEIELLSWNWSTENHVKWDINQGGQSTKTVITPIDMEKYVDSATHLLYQVCVNGKHIKSGVLTARKNAGDQKIDYLTIELEDIMVNKMEWQGQSEEAFVKERLQLSFAQFKIKYAKQDDTGAATTVGDVGWNIQKQKAA
jgi:type VI secretion system secreted protein Hcp